MIVNRPRTRLPLSAKEVSVQCRNFADKKQRVDRQISVTMSKEFDGSNSPTLLTNKYVLINSS